MLLNTMTKDGKVILCKVCYPVDGKAKRTSTWTCDACMKDIHELRKAISKLKLSKEVRGILMEIGLETRIMYREGIEALKDEIAMWERLWCDQPEDRLYHAKDRTWWRRLTKKEQDRETKQEMKHYGVSRRRTEYSPYGADPPPEIMTIVRAARKLPKKDKRLKDALAGFEVYE